jgi:hypothetical protein
VTLDSKASAISRQFAISFSITIRRKVASNCSVALPEANARPAGTVPKSEANSGAARSVAA